MWDFLFAIEIYFKNDGNIFVKLRCMEVSTQVSYKGYRADYTITSFNSVSYMAELTGFSGFEGDNPPSHFCFVKTRGRVIASSDVVDIVKSLAKQLYSENSIELQEVY